MYGSVPGDRVGEASYLAEKNKYKILYKHLELKKGNVKHLKVLEVQYIKIFLEIN